MKELKLNREGNLVSKTHRECSNKNCKSIFAITSKTVTLCPKCNSNRVKCTDPRSKMLMRAKSRAKVKNITFNLTIEDIQIPSYCPILGIKLNCHKGASGGRKNSPALDRINPQLGYVKGNIRVISHLANMMKSHASEEEMVLFAKWVNKEFPG